MIANIIITIDINENNNVHISDINDLKMVINNRWVIIM